MKSWSRWIIRLDNPEGVQEHQSSSSSPQDDNGFSTCIHVNCLWIVFIINHQSGQIQIQNLRSSKGRKGRWCSEWWRSSLLCISSNHLPLLFGMGRFSSPGGTEKARGVRGMVAGSSLVSYMKDYIQGWTDGNPDVDIILPPSPIPRTETIK